MIHGVAVSPGIAVASAYCFHEVFDRETRRTMDPEDLSSELARFNEACDDAAAELRALIEKVSYEIGEQESAIFRAHLLMLRDRAFLSKVQAIIVDGKRDAPGALRDAMSEYEKIFEQIPDEYLQERIVDLRDVVARIQNHLVDERVFEDVALDEPVILIAHEIFPSHTVGLGKLKIAGIITEHGGGTSHAAIIARSMGIPAVSGIPNVFQQVKTGDLVALDGREGCFLVNPEPEAETAYRKLQREFFDLKDYLIENRDQPAVTTDGQTIELLANINTVGDARTAADVGAKGIGLFRTEYLFMTHPTIPDEEEQYKAYCAVLDACPGLPVTIRTLDLGGDKTVPYLGRQRESNPFMGWRSIRLSFEHPEFFRTQLRAILRAGARGDVRMMFPMITTVEELRRVNRMVWQVERQLEREGVEYGRQVQRGIMVEVPAAAVCIDHLVDHADFVSIGTNDLIQYLTAADRDNPKVAHLCEPLGPAVLQLLHHVIGVCNERSIPVSVCGEMAGRPRCVLALLAFGLHCLSMSPAFVPIIKELVHTLRLSDLRAIAKDVLRRRSGRQARGFLDDVLRSVNPRLAMLEFN